MGKNKKENFIFTLICCALMVFGMALYNVILRNGINSSLLKETLMGFLPVFFVALILDWFVVGKIAKSIVSKIVDHNAPLIKKVLLISFFMVCGMSFCITLIVSAAHMGISADFPLLFLKAWGMNFICALPLQLLIVGPIARGIFFKMYPAN